MARTQESSRLLSVFGQCEVRSDVNSLGSDASVTDRVLTRTAAPTRPTSNATIPDRTTALKLRGLTPL